MKTSFDLDFSILYTKGMKNILFCSPKYFGYETIICEKMKSKGFNVTWYDDRPTQSTLKKCILRVAPSIMKRNVNKYFNDILLENANKNINTVFVILGQCLTPEIMLKFRKNLPNAKFILYLWDSVKNFPNKD